MGTRSLLVRGLGGVLLALLAVGLVAADQPVLRLGVVGFYNPRLMYLKYQPLADYLSRHTGEKWELEISTTYQGTVQALCEGRLALAYLGPFTYVRAHQACGVVPVVRLNTAGSDTYRSLIMVREDSPIRTVEQLMGKRVAFGAPLSVSSHLMPRAMIMAAGLDPGRDIDCLYFGHHDRAARAVLIGEADACGVRDIVGQRYAHRGLRIVATSDPIPNFPLVGAPGMAKSLREELIQVLVDLPWEDPKVAKEMSAWDVELSAGFARCCDGDFNPIRTLARKVFGEQALKTSGEDLCCGPRDR